MQDEVESEKASDGNELMSECLTREEVEQALDSLKKKSALGSDGLTAEMVCCNVLVDFGAASSIGAGGMGGFLLSGRKV